ncbi:MAG TPA: hypothetical protein VFY92_03085, partial [Hyphomicrobiaceae bacterium]|nr:hypothetical protein [Hyphomicrobiaceae bacterium]
MASHIGRRADKIGDGAGQGTVRSARFTLFRRPGDGLAIVAARAQDLARAQQQAATASSPRRSPLHRLPAATFEAPAGLQGFDPEMPDIRAPWRPAGPTSSAARPAAVIC